MQSQLASVGINSNQSISTWGSQVVSLVGSLEGYLDDIYDAIVAKGGTPTEGDYSTYASAIAGLHDNLESLNVTPSTVSQNIVPSGNIDGYNEVNVEAVNSSIDANIIDSNIKAGVTILGVVGTYTGA